MAKPLLPDELWMRIEPLLPPLPPHPLGGRPWLGNREALGALAASVEAGYSDADRLRGIYRERESLNDVARMQSDLWMAA